jgi:CheY-like chemotaxis protein
MDYLHNTVALPDIIFLDINMPRKNGIQCLDEIRSDERLKNITIAIYSTSGAERDIEETFIKGANVYIRKPNDFAALKKIVEEAMRINWQYHVAGLSKDAFMLSV